MRKFLFAMVPALLWAAAGVTLALALACAEGGSGSPTDPGQPPGGAPINLVAQGNEWRAIATRAPVAPGPKENPPRLWRGEWKIEGEAPPGGAFVKVVFWGEDGLGYSSPQEVSGRFSIAPNLTPPVGHELIEISLELISKGVPVQSFAESERLGFWRTK